MQKDGEPSVEDILRSIKKVISREDDGQAPRGIGTQVGYTPTFAGSRAFGQRDAYARGEDDRPIPAAVPDRTGAATDEMIPGEDVYELGDLAGDAPAMEPEASRAEPEDTPADLRDPVADARAEAPGHRDAPMQPAPPAERAPEAEPFATPAASTPVPQPASTATPPIVDDGLVAGAAAAAMRDQLAALSTLTARAARPETPAHPLEEVVRDMLRPMLKDWLDQNLQGIVERSVQAEIARISGRG